MMEWICFIKIVSHKSFSLSIDKCPAHDFVFHKCIALVEIISLCIVVCKSFARKINEAPSHDFILYSRGTLTERTNFLIIIADSLAVKIRNIPPHYLIFLYNKARSIIKIEIAAVVGIIILCIGYRKSAKERKKEKNVFHMRLFCLDFGDMKKFKCPGQRCL